MATKIKTRRSGIPTGHAGEYFVMGELLRRGLDAQLADRNTKGYDILAGRPEWPSLQKIQVKTVRAGAWYVKTRDFKGELCDRVTIYVLIGGDNGNKPVRFFIAKNRWLTNRVRCPAGWKKNGYMPLRDVRRYEDKWENLFAATKRPS